MLDRMVADLEDEEEEDELAQPNVTRFNELMSVTFGGGASAAPIPNSDDCYSEPERDILNHPVPSKPVSPKPQRANTIMEELTRNGGKVVDEHSGEIQRLWSQTRDEVIVSVLVPAGTSAAELDVKLLISEDDNIMQLKGTVRPTLSVVLAGKPLLKGRLAYDIHVQDEDDEGDIDWNLEDFDNGHRFIKVRGCFFFFLFVHCLSLQSLAL